MRRALGFKLAFLGRVLQFVAWESDSVAVVVTRPAAGWLDLRACDIAWDDSYPGIMRTLGSSRAPGGPTLLSVGPNAAGELPDHVRFEAVVSAVGPEATGRVFDGHGLMTIARDWIRRGAAGSLRPAVEGANAGAGHRSPRGWLGCENTASTPRGRTLGQLSAAVLEGAIDRHTWRERRAVLLNPERKTNVRMAESYLLTSLLNCDACRAAMFSRARDDHTKSATCAPVVARVTSLPSSPNRSTTSSRSGRSSSSRRRRSEARCWPRRAETMTAQRVAPSPSAAQRRAGGRASTTTSTSAVRWPRAAAARSGSGWSGR